MNSQNTEGKDGAESIQRYQNMSVGNNWEMHPVEWGPWVKYEDYARTESELTRLRAEAKPMTVEELQWKFEKEFGPDYMQKDETGDYILLLTGHRWDAFLACARLLGRVKE